MSDYNYYLEYLKHVDSDTEEHYRQREEKVRQNAEHQIQMAKDEAEKRVQKVEAQSKSKVDEAEAKCEAMSAKMQAFVEDVKVHRQQDLDNCEKEKRELEAKFEKQFKLLEAEKQELSQKMQTFVEDVKSKRQSEMQNMDADKKSIAELYESRISESNSQHAKELSAKESECSKRMAELAEKHKKEVAESNAQHAKALAAKESECSKRMAELNAQHQKEIQAIEENTKKSISEMQAKVAEESVVNMKEKLNSLEKTIKDKDDSIKDYKKRIDKQRKTVKTFFFVALSLIQILFIVLKVTKATAIAQDSWWVILTPVYIISALIIFPKIINKIYNEIYGRYLRTTRLGYILFGVGIAMQIAFVVLKAFDVTAIAQLNWSEVFIPIYFLVFYISSLFQKYIFTGERFTPFVLLLVQMTFVLLKAFDVTVVTQWTWWEVLIPTYIHIGLRIHKLFEC